MNKLLSLFAVMSLALVPQATGQVTSATVPTDLAAAPTYAGRYDVASGVFLPGPKLPPPPGSAVVVYDNSATNGSFFTPGPGAVNMDWGILSAGGNNDITEFDIGYATSDTNPIAITIHLHEGATGFGDAGTTINSIPIAGLPGSVSGNPEGVIVTITLASAVKILDGALGYSYEMFDTVSGPLLIGPPNEAGVIDAFDQYDSAFNPIGTFNFGGPPAPMASFYMAMSGVEPECFLVFGGGLGSDNYAPNGFQFNTGLSDVKTSFPVLMDDYPSFVIPNDHGAIASGGSLGGGSSTSGTYNLPDFIGPHGFFTVQVMMWNPVDVPGNPEQYSQVLVGRLTPDGNVICRAKGAGAIDITLDKTVNANGETVFSFPFAVSF
ncbi:MAG: hypothetical protein ACI9EF_002397 [Pseudohongiellaceae bacterium]|jgi:hypothetical protein